MIFKSSMGLGKSRCDVFNGYHPRMGLPNIVIYNSFTFTSMTLNQIDNCIQLFTRHLHACTTKLG